MAHQFRRTLPWLPLLTLGAVFPASWLVSTASAEERKFVVILADMPKDAPGERVLANPGLVYDSYFDKTKNGQAGSIRVDSFAEWWEEVSYGNVTVSGDAYGWIQLPWRTSPPGNELVAPTINLQGSFTFDPFISESPDISKAKFKRDTDGFSDGARPPAFCDQWGNCGPEGGDNAPLVAGAMNFDFVGQPLWTPGERFGDLNTDGVYQAGVREWGIDKNGDGQISGPPAANMIQLTQIRTFRRAQPAGGQACDPTPPDEIGISTADAPGNVVGSTAWASAAEWIDFNGDGLWNGEGRTLTARTWQITVIEPNGCGPAAHTTATFRTFKGDWGGEELWVDTQGQAMAPQRAASHEPGQAPDLGAFLLLAYPPAEQGQPPETVNFYFDEQNNSVFDYPEPFEDFMRRWSVPDADFVPLAPDGTEGPDGTLVPSNADGEYVALNYPGPAFLLADRTGNGKYDPADDWRNNGSNKGQYIEAIVLDPTENGEQQAQASTTTPEPAWYQDWWFEEFGNQAPPWVTSLEGAPDFIPYVRRFNPNAPIPPNAIQDNPPVPMKWEPNRGGPFGNGLNFGFVTYPNANVRPDPRTDGMFDAAAEYKDLPSSIYHSGGDFTFGEVTGPQGNRNWGEDIGNGPDSPDADGTIPAAGPAAFNVHGDGGWDAGNQLSIEFLTFRTDGTSLTDDLIDLDGDGQPDVAQWHSDTNLDGLIDMGEQPGYNGQYGVFNQNHTTYVPNYGADARAGGRPDGNPDNDYPFNRQRMMEDAVEALDNTVRWDNFLGGPPPFGNVVSGVVLVSDRSPGRMFRLPAASFDLPIRTRDRVLGPETFRSSYVPLTFFNGLGITISAFGNDQGDPIEGDSIEPNPSLGFQMPWACHEYAHSWEGFPDLYDYDVYRTFDSVMLNNPISRWCVMAGGGAVHPVPILKADPRNGHTGWIKPVDITTALKPAAVTSLTLKPWEFDRDKSVFVYTNELFPGEQFWFWKTAPQALKGGAQQLTFDRFMPANGMLIMHVDRSGDPEGLPQQQRTGNRFTYLIVQADGLQELENGDNNGDPGDVWPGTTAKTEWNRDTDPSNRWYSNQNSGLSILGMQQSGANTVVSFRWVPQDVPSFSWKQPPGGISVNSEYQLQYVAYDQFGGTQIQFFIYKNEPQKAAPGTPESYEPSLATQINPAAVKFPGEIDGVYNVNVANLLLLDGTYTFYAKLVPGVGADNRLENSASRPRPSINNRGNGNLTINSVDLDVSKLEAWNVRCVEALQSGAEKWLVTGDVTGVRQLQATTGQPYASDPVTFAGGQHSHVSFTIQSGSVPFQVGDEFNFLTTGFTPHSAAVLINELEVIEPQPPIPSIRIDGEANGLAPFQVVFHHDQTQDPGGASMTFQWDFGDGSPLVTTDRLDQPIVHTYTTAREQPYNATLTVTNSFGQSASQSIAITVREAIAPTVRVAVNPSSGPAPLTVDFTGSLTTDPNPGTLGLDYVWDFGDGSPVATTANASHTYTRAGNYRATLTVTNRPYGKTARATIEVRVIGVTGNLPPEAVITTSARFGQAPLAVRFDAAGSSDPEGSALSYEWNFGDGTAVGRGAVVDHTFTKVGTFNVILTVRDDRDQVDTAVVAIVVTSASNNGSPVARIEVSGTQGPAPFQVNFSASRSADPEGGSLKYAWDFGDDVKAEGVNTSHVYERPGRYIATLTVTDGLGLAGATTVEINVTSAAGDAGQDQPGLDDLAPELGGCGAGCGPAGFAPLMLMLLSLTGLRRFGKRYFR